MNANIQVQRVGDRLRLRRRGRTIASMKLGSAWALAERIEHEATKLVRRERPR